MPTIFRLFSRPDLKTTPLTELQRAEKLEKEK